MAAATVDVPVVQMFRTGFAPMVWPITAPLATINRSMLAPSVSLAATVVVPKATIQRTVFAPFVGGFSPATAVATFDIQRGAQYFYITKAQITPAG